LAIVGRLGGQRPQAHVQGLVKTFKGLNVSAHVGGGVRRRDHLRLGEPPLRLL